MRRAVTNYSRPPAPATINPMTTLVTFLIVALAVVRVTRLITTDRLTDGPRQWLVDKWGTTNLMVYLFFCPWCIGFWVSVVGAWMVWYPGGLEHYVTLPWWAGIGATAFALSYITGWVLTKEAN